jgi:serralysin
MATMTGTAGDDTLVGTAAGDLLRGLAGYDLLKGGAGDDRLEGGDGKDRLYGEAGNDLLYGGAGDDYYYIDGIGDRVFETSGNGIDRVYSSVSFNLTGQSLEQLILTGTSAIDATGNGGANAITGNSAANLLDGGAGADTLRGRGGNDVYHVDNAADAVTEYAGEGLDTVLSSVSFTLGDEVERLTLVGTAAINGTGNSLSNTIAGNSAANTLDGGRGADILRGGAGNDIYRVDNVADRISESSGNGSDTVLSSVSFTLATYVEKLTLTGTGAITGTGNGHANRIIGNGAANLLDGAAGIDVLTGGAGADTFAFSSPLGSANADTITDFKPGEDRIRIGGAGGQPFAALASGDLGSGAFRVGAAAADVSDRIVYNSSTGALLYDADGSGTVAALQIATLGKGLSLTAGSFTVSGPANSLPTIGSGTTARVEENVAVSTVVYQTIAQDSDGDRIVYGLSGADASYLRIDQNGAVRFVASPDYETKSSYVFTVKAVDSSGAGSSRTVTLSVANLTEGVRTVAETSGSNDQAGSAQPLSRSLFTASSDQNINDPSLPSLRISGRLSSPSDRDFYSVTLKEGELLVLDVDGTPTLDSFLRVVGPSGAEVASNDDLGSFDPGSTAHPGVSHNQDSFLRFRAPADGKYIFSIEAFAEETGPTTDGDYKINVSIGPPAGREELDEENVEALLSGDLWSDLSLTYGFPTSASDYGADEGVEEKPGMEPLNGQQQSAVLQILGLVSKVTNLSFSEAGSPGQAQLRYALSNEPETAHAYYPGSGDGGDSWYNELEYNAPVVGNYEWTTFIHETGHALGLKHAQEAPAVASDRDSLEYTVMTYRSYVGAPVGEEDGGYRNERWGYPQTLMMYDIAALQKMYGADFGYNSGNNVYSWSPTNGAFLIDGVTQWTPGANRVFMTLWDGGGTDTIDLSKYSVSVTIDLRPGEWTKTSAVQLANLGEGNYARGNVANALQYNGDARSLIENAVGGPSGDKLIANAAVNRLIGGAGDDQFFFNSIGDSPAAAPDTISDFKSGVDRIMLSAIDANTNTATNDAFLWVGKAAFSGKAGELRYETRADGVLVQADVTGDALPDFALILSNLATISHVDFVI